MFGLKVLCPTNGWLPLIASDRTTHPRPGWHFASDASGDGVIVIRLYWIQHVLTRRLNPLLGKNYVFSPAMN
jgi:hypothetical protein